VNRTFARRARQLSVFGFALLVTGCPRPRPMRPPAPPSLSEPARPAQIPPGEPPFRIAVTLAGQQPLTDAEALREVLLHNLELSGAFVTSSTAPTTEVDTLVQLETWSTSGRITARAALSFPARGETRPTSGYTLVANSPRRLALMLANALYRFHLNQPGPFASKIAFVAGTGANRRSRQIFVMDFDGENLHRVSSGDAQNILPAWSPRGSLVYSTFARGNPQLVVQDRHRPAPSTISARPGLNVGAAFAPDGREVALTLSLNGNSDIYIISPDGKMIRRLTRHPKIDVSPTWSPDGKQLAFVSERAGTPQLYVMTDGGGQARRLTFKGSYNQEPDWCSLPGSTQIAYTSGHGHERYEIHLLDIISGETRQLTTGGSNMGPSWSPDCRLIVYSAGDRGLWTISPDGGQPRQLYRGPAQTPAWSDYRTAL